MIIFDRYYNISFNTIYYCIILPIVFIGSFYANNEVILCDGTGMAESGFNYKAPGWGGELDGRPITGGVSTQVGGNVYTGYPIYDNEGISLYQPYNSGLQSTGGGYRYELGGSQVSRYELDGGQIYHELDGGQGFINLNATYYTTDGRGVPLEYEYRGLDSNGNPIYHYSYSNSTQLGEVVPTRTEVLNDNYSHGGLKIPLDTSKTTFKGRIKNKVKTSIKNHIAKSSDESIRQDRLRVELSSKRLHEYKRVARAHDSRRVIDITNGNTSGSYTKRVRRWD